MQVLTEPMQAAYIHSMWEPIISRSQPMQAAASLDSIRAQLAVVFGNQDAAKSRAEEIEQRWTKALDRIKEDTQDIAKAVRELSNKHRSKAVKPLLHKTAFKTVDGVRVSSPVKAVDMFEYFHDAIDPEHEKWPDVTAWLNMIKDKSKKVVMRQGQKVGDDGEAYNGEETIGASWAYRYFPMFVG